jgi:ribosomal protein L11 methyltransferase
MQFRSTEAATIEQWTIETVAGSLRRISADKLEKLLCKRFRLPRRDAGLIIRRLVKKGELVYTYELGCSFVEISFQRPVRITDELVLLPENLSYSGSAKDVPVYLKSGAAFGTGQHPTTRLALKGIVYALSGEGPMNPYTWRPCSVLDVGTGSGVLAIAAVKLGIDRGLGIDIDECAGAEARENVRINGLEEKLRIAIQAIDDKDIGSGFVMLTANLRLPSLVKLCGRFAELIRYDGCIVLSGIRVEEVQRLVELYSQYQFTPCWQADENGWAGIVFVKRDTD